jgi:hypothetical protein
MLGVSNASGGQVMGLVTNVGNNSTHTDDNRYYSGTTVTYTSEPAVAMYDRPTDGDEIMVTEYNRTKVTNPTRTQGLFGVQSNSMLPFGRLGANPNIELFGGEYNVTSNFTFGEVIYYGCTTTGCSGGKSTVEKNKIESYLSMKYGTTMRARPDTANTSSTAATNYVDSGNTVVWNATTANLHTNRIAFIGQDDASAWRKTASAIIAPAGTEILKISNPSDLEDREFASVADDNAQITNAVSSNSPQGFASRLARTWKWQTVGGDGVGSVNLAFDLTTQTAIPNNGAPATYKLMIDTDGDFTSGAIISNITPTVSAGVVTFAGVPQAQLTNGAQIAIGQPGAVLTYSNATWNEAAANDGTIDTTTPTTITFSPATFLTIGVITFVLTTVIIFFWR